MCLQGGCKWLQNIAPFHSPLCFTLIFGTMLVFSICDFKVTKPIQGNPLLFIKLNKCNTGAVLDFQVYPGAHYLKTKPQNVKTKIHQKSKVQI